MAAPFNVVFALYPRITQLDFTGPYEVLTRLPGARCVLASVAGGDLEVDSVMRFAGLQRLDRVEECDLLCVP
jgi:putative intracellular protease/amidase